TTGLTRRHIQPAGRSKGGRSRDASRETQEAQTALVPTSVRCSSPRKVAHAKHSSAPPERWECSIGYSELRNQITKYSEGAARRRPPCHRQADQGRVSGRSSSRSGPCLRSGESRVRFGAPGRVQD